MAASLLSGTPGANAVVGQIRSGADTGGDYRLGNNNAAARGDAGIGITVDPANSQRLVQVDQDLVREECEFSRSTDGGTTWSAGQDFQAPAAYSQNLPGPCSVVGHGAANIDQTSVAWGSGNNVYATFAAKPTATGPGFSVLLAKSTDAGATFSVGAEIPGLVGGASASPDHYFPEIAVDPGAGTGGADRVYISARQTATTPTSTAKAVVVRSDDGGATWGSVVEASNSSASPAAYTCSPAAPTGTTTATCTLTAQGDTHRFATEVTPPVLGPAPAGGGNRPLFVAWRSLKTRAAGNCTPATTTVNCVGPPTNEVDGETFSDGYLVVAKSTDNGATWTRVRAVNVRSFIYTGPVAGPYSATPTYFGDSTFPRLAVSPTNGANGPSVYLTWNQAEGAPAAANCGTGPWPGGAGAVTCPAYSANQFQSADHFINNDNDVWFMRSTDGGGTWGDLKQLNDPKKSGLVAPEVTQTRHPNISIAPDGRIDVVWQDRRHWYLNTSERANIQNKVGACTHTHAACLESRLGDTYYAHSGDGGGTFSANRRVNDRSHNNDVGYDYRFSTYWDYGPVSVPLGNDQILVANHDSRLGNFDTDTQDFYLRKVNLNAGAGAVPVVNLPAGDASAVTVNLSQRANPGGSEAQLGATFANRAATRVVIVNRDDVAGALAGGVLARANVGPLLATPASGLPTAVRDEVDRMNPLGAYLIGDNTALSAQVEADLVAAGVPSTAITRISGTSTADVAKQIAVTHLDRRAAADKTSSPPLPAFDAAIIANPNSPEASSAAALAANRRLPVLYVDRDAIPADTSTALSSLAINKTLVVGGTNAVGAAVVSQLTTDGRNPTRLDGADQYATSNSVVTESVARGLPKNVVYVADGNTPVHAALMGAAVGRIGGLLLLSPGASASAAQSTVTSLGLAGGLDRLVVAPSLLGGTFTPVTPARILDTRDGTGSCTGGCVAVGPGQTLTLQVAGQGGVPASGASAVVMNVTVTQPTSGGYITAWPSDGVQPTASNLNFSADQTVPNLVTVKLGSDGKVKLFNSSGTTHLIADVAGWYDDGTLAPASRYNPVTPARILDTRSAAESGQPTPVGTCTPSPCAAVGPGQTLTLDVAGKGGVPASGATAVVMNTTVTGPTSGGYLTVWPDGTPQPTASNLNFSAGQTVPNLVTVKLGVNGKVNIFNSSGTTHVISDVAGWYGAAGATAGSRITALAPARLLDTRSAAESGQPTPVGTCTPSPCAAVGPGQTVTLQVAGVGGVPPTGTTAVVMNMTAVSPTAGGYITVWPSGATQPTASNLNFSAGQTVPNLVMVKLGSDGKVNIFNSTGSTHVISDVAGWFNQSGA